MGVIETFEQGTETVTDKLPFALRLEVERQVMKLCRVTRATEVKWVDDNNEQLSNLVDSDEKVKAAARTGDIDTAAALIVEKFI